MPTQRHLAPAVDLGRVRHARVYDYLIGGNFHLSADRLLADRVSSQHPDVISLARQNRALIDRFVRILADAGIRQFLDLGCGLPTRHNVHDIAKQVISDARVVYVDHDPFVIAHMRALLDNSRTVAAVHADVREPEQILRNPYIGTVIDFDQPLAIMMLGVLHYIDDAWAPHELLRELHDATVAGSYLAVSHLTATTLGSPSLTSVEQAYSEAGIPITIRSPRTIARFFDELEPVQPGLAETSWWHSSPDVRSVAGPLRILAGLARKPTAATPARSRTTHEGILDDCTRADCMPPRRSLPIHSGLVAGRKSVSLRTQSSKIPGSGLI